MQCKNCIDSVDIYSIECIRDPCLVSTVLTYIVLMVWLKSPKSQADIFVKVYIPILGSKLKMYVCGYLLFSYIMCKLLMVYTSLKV